LTKGVSAENIIAYQGSPAVVKIFTTFDGTLKSSLYQKNTVQLWGNMHSTFLQQEQPDYSGAFTLDIPQFSYGGQGTGFVISSDGYIVTNAHVVDMSDEELKSKFVQQAVKWAINNWPEMLKDRGFEVFPQTTDEVNYIIEFFNAYQLQRSSSPQIYVYFGDPSGNADMGEGHPAEISKSDPAEMKYSADKFYRYRSGKDIAVIKCEGVHDLITATLGDSNSVDVGDKVIVVGYPGVAESGFHDYLSRKTDLVPTVTSGIISARKKLPDDSDVFQTDTSITHGNSGGPAFSENGEVIGIATFVSYTYLEGDVYTEVQGFNFLIPINVAMRFIKELNVDTTPSQSTQHLFSGLNYYWTKDYSQALREFNAVRNVNTVDRYSLNYAAKCQAAGQL